MTFTPDTVKLKSTGPMFPLDLVMVVLEHFRLLFVGEGSFRKECVATLQSCSLVCRTWTSIAQKELFSHWVCHDLELGKDPRESSLVIMEERPDLAQYVVHLTIRTLQWSRRITQTFPNVTFVHLIYSHHGVLVESSLPQALGDFPRLRSLDIMHSTFGLMSPTDLLFSARLSLNKLHLNRLGRETDAIVEALSRTTSAASLRNIFLRSSYFMFDAKVPVWSRLWSALPLFSQLENLALGSVYSRATPQFEATMQMRGASLSLGTLRNLKKVSMVFESRRTLGGDEHYPHAAFYLSELFSAANLPALRDISIAFERGRTPRDSRPADPRSAETNHVLEVCPFGHRDSEEKGLSPWQLSHVPPIIPVSIASKLESFTLIFRLDVGVDVVVRHGQAFLELLGEAGRSGTLQVETNGGLVAFARS